MELPPELLREARELVFGYEELLRQAQASIEAELEKIDPKERGQYSIGQCPECGNSSVLVSPEEHARCHYCNQQVFVEICERCGNYYPPETLFGVGICNNCFVSLGA